jgi:hypothetical protein
MSEVQREPSFAFLFTSLIAAIVLALYLVHQAAALCP